MVLQDTWLFGGTIYDNIAYGRPDADEDEVIEAARAAYVDRFVHTLPDGYETWVSDDGGNISAGEKQLITIARAFLARPQLLILDEATSSVDTRTELLIQHAMVELRRDRTSFIIAHRLSTIRDADLILVMEAGQDRRAGQPRRAAGPARRILGDDAGLIGLESSDLLNANRRAYRIGSGSDDRMSTTTGAHLLPVLPGLVRHRSHGRGQPRHQDLRRQAEPAHLAGLLRQGPHRQPARRASASDPQPDAPRGRHATSRPPGTRPSPTSRPG